MHPRTYSGTQNRGRHGFTLIELLVVISIIVLLLSLLAPALDAAIYQAELTACAARQDALASSGTLYAMDFDRHYPHRAANGDWFIAMIDNQFDDPVNSAQYPPYDMVVATNGYISTKLWGCPIAPEMIYDVEFTDEGEEAYNQIILSSFDHRFDWQYANASSMSKIGQKWSYTDNTSSQPVTLKSNVIIGDRDRIWRSGQATGSHPDKRGVMGEKVVGRAIDGYANELWYFGRWQKPDGGGLRPEVDLNFTYQDGSTQRFVDVTANDPLVSETVDERMFRVPSYGSSAGAASNNTEWLNVPKN